MSFKRNLFKLIGFRQKWCHSSHCHSFQSYLEPHRRKQRSRSERYQGDHVSRALEQDSTLHWLLVSEFPVLLQDMIKENLRWWAEEKVFSYQSSPSCSLLYLLASLGPSLAADHLPLSKLSVKISRDICVLSCNKTDDTGVKRSRKAFNQCFVNIYSRSKWLDVWSPWNKFSIQRSFFLVALNYSSLTQLLHCLKSQGWGLHSSCRSTTDWLTCQLI